MCDQTCLVNLRWKWQERFLLTNDVMMIIRMVLLSTCLLLFLYLCCSEKCISLTNLNSILHDLSCWLHDLVYVQCAMTLYSIFRQFLFGDRNWCRVLIHAIYIVFTVLMFFCGIMLCLLFCMQLNEVTTKCYCSSALAPGLAQRQRMWRTKSLSSWKKQVSNVNRAGEDEDVEREYEIGCKRHTYL